MYAKRLELMVELSKSGFNTVEIGKIFRLSDVTVALLFQKEGLDPRKTYRRWMFNRIINLMRGGMSTVQVGIFLGVSREDVNYYFRQFGLSQVDCKKQNYENINY